MRYLRFPPLDKELRATSGPTAGKLQDLLHALLYRPRCSTDQGPPGASQAAAAAASASAPAGAAAGSAAGEQRAGPPSLSISEQVMSYSIQRLTTWELFEMGAGLRAGFIAMASMWSNYRRARRAGRAPRMPHLRFKSSAKPDNRRVIALPGGRQVRLGLAWVGPQAPTAGGAGASAAATPAAARGDGCGEPARGTLVHALLVPAVCAHVDLGAIHTPPAPVWGQPPLRRDPHEHLTVPRDRDGHLVLLGSKYAQFALQKAAAYAAGINPEGEGQYMTRRQVTTAANAHLVTLLASLGAAQRDRGAVKEEDQGVFNFDAGEPGGMPGIASALTVVLQDRKKPPLLSLPYHTDVPKKNKLRERESELPMGGDGGEGDGGAAQQPPRHARPRTPLRQVIGQARAELSTNNVGTAAKDIEDGRRRLNRVLQAVARRCTSPRLANAWLYRRAPAGDDAAGGSGGECRTRPLPSRTRTVALTLLARPAAGDVQATPVLELEEEEVANLLPVLGTVRVGESHSRVQAARAAVNNIEQKSTHRDASTGRTIPIPTPTVRLCAHLGLKVGPGGETCIAEHGVDDVVASLAQGRGEAAQLSEDEVEEVRGLAERTKEAIKRFREAQPLPNSNKQVQMFKPEEEVMDMFGGAVQALARAARVTVEPRMPRARKVRPAPPWQSGGTPPWRSGRTPSQKRRERRRKAKRLNGMRKKRDDHVQQALTQQPREAEEEGGSGAAGGGTGSHSAGQGGRKRQVDEASKQTRAGEGVRGAKKPRRGGGGSGRGANAKGGKGGGTGSGGRKRPGTGGASRGDSESFEAPVTRSASMRARAVAAGVASTSAATNGSAGNETQPPSKRRAVNEGLRLQGGKQSGASARTPSWPAPPLTYAERRG